MAQAHPADPSPAVVGALVENHRRFLAFVERRVASRDAAEEIVQSAFVRGLERAGDIRDEERTVAWFYRLLRNGIVDHWRSKGGEAKAVEAFWQEQDLAQPPAEVEAELCSCFEPLLSTLKPEYAEALRRIDLEGIRPIDFAAAVGISANNAMVRLHRARRALRERLVASCRTCAEHGCLDCSCQPAPHETSQSCGHRS
jgi:RNA polymerase sigma factor (sigma-70 family)